MGSWAPEGMWLVPAAVLALGAAWRLTRGRDRRDPLRAGLLLWGSWLAVVLVVLGSLRGISHGYYTVEFVPAVAGATALGGAVVWTRWSTGAPRWTARVLAAGLLATAVWAAILLAHQPSWPMLLTSVVVAGTAVAVIGVLYAGDLRCPQFSPSPWRHGGLLPLTVVLTLLLGPIAWSVATAGQVHHGPNVVSGPSRSLLQPSSTPAGRPAAEGAFPSGMRDKVLGGSGGYPWAAAVVGHRAADLQLATGVPVLAVGGYFGRDPSPTLPEFVTAAASHRVHYLLFTKADLRGFSQASRIALWAVRCTPIESSGGWLMANVGVPSTAAPACGGPSTTQRG